MSKQEYLLALSESELRAVDRVLCAVAHSNYPIVARVVDEALGTLPTADFRRGLAHLHGALLAKQEKHPLECACEDCLAEMLDGIPDTTEQRDAAFGDLGVPTVGHSDTTLDARD